MYLTTLQNFLKQCKKIKYSALIQQTTLRNLILLDIFQLYQPWQLKLYTKFNRTVVDEEPKRKSRGKHINDSMILSLIHTGFACLILVYAAGGPDYIFGSSTEDHWKLHSLGIPIEWQWVAQSIKLSLYFFCMNQRSLEVLSLRVAFGTGRKLEKVFLALH